ncbi:hypothetical protein GGQ02_002688 [Salinibacter ruber]|uniref:DUF304 domain-containing protein n=4 Tax=Salinibacter ruber TaxID=146919 RepID=Q2RZ17_SALRD|nr:hypothetical protein [Salinibacter ruber]ABC45906.1 hypothetical protein SRU_2722 [Salinibacter ruber DSM 13855]MCS3950349.1 hypothetical protein [Salinibacter ruber]MCS4034287.1 hypothetical protein [Salinibacter ruber]
MRARIASTDPMRYKHTQVGYVTGGLTLAALPLLYYAFMVEDGELGLLAYTMLGGFGVLAVLFSSLTVTVTDQELVFYFGPGFWTRRFALNDIVSAEVVRNSALHGWGIRYTRHGWLYNVSGLRAVQLNIRGEGQIRIGTDEPEALKQALDEVTAR